MLFKIKTEEGDLELSPNQILEVLMSKHMTVDREDFTVLSNEFAKFMQFREALHEATIQQLLLIAFSLGYFYKVMREKNEVEIINESSTEQSGNEPSSPDGMRTSSD